MDKKTKILMGCNGIPADSLYNYIQEGSVSLQELVNVGLEVSTVDYLRSKFAAHDESAWQKAVTINTPISYAEYLSVYPMGNHVDEAHHKMVELEDAYWSYVRQNMSEDILRQYLKLYPTGVHCNECKEILEDLPWLEACKKNTILGYITYGQNYPDRHVEDVKHNIKLLEDERDWEKAHKYYVEFDDKKYVQEYLEQYSPQYAHKQLEYTGRYVEQAIRIITQVTPDDLIVKEIENDKNAYPVETNEREGIRNMVENGKISWKKLEKVFSERQLDAIKTWNGNQSLPKPEVPETLIGDSTEVYIWGTKGTGKTCCLGAVLSSVKRQGIFIPQECRGYNYMIALSNLFASGDNSIFSLPPRTNLEDIAEMGMTLVDQKKREHNLTMIDIAGEVFSGVYKIGHCDENLILPQERRVIEQIQNYLKQKHNDTIHFFVVEYGGAYKNVKELEPDRIYVQQRDVLQNMTQYLKKNKIFSSSTVGVYILVTKCDMIPCKREDRAEMAHDYVTEHYTAFYNELEKACIDNNISEFQTIAFSIGDVFAQELCEFDPEDTNKIVEELLGKTRARNKWTEWLRK